MGKIQILSNQRISLIICRIARQIMEDYYQEPTILLAGIKSSGYEFAELLAKEIEKISPNTKVNLGFIEINKTSPSASNISSNLAVMDAKNKVIVIVDDVLNTGRTLIFGVNHFLLADAKAIKTAVLVDRSHNHFPVKADYIGFTLATTLKEHVEVLFSENESVAYLS